MRSAHLGDAPNVTALVAGTVHELRNPVFALGATVDALEQRLGATSEVAAHLSALRNELERILCLARELGELVTPVGPRVPTPINELVSRVIAGFAAAAQPQQTPIVLRAVAAGLVDADAPRLEAALGRLVGLALCRTPAGGTVEVAIDRPAAADTPSVQISVRDVGPLLEPRALRDALVPFGLRRAGKLTLDVAIANALVQAHGGNMTVANGEHQGLRFTIELPSAASSAVS